MVQFMKYSMPYLAFYRLLGLLLCWLSVLPAVQAADFLPPNKAFVASARLADPQTIELRYQIADGYYLYRERFRFQLEGDQPILGAARFPAGQIKQDPNFGKVEVYHRELRIQLPLSAAAKGPLILKATSQGCADAGLCYPPQTQALKLSSVNASVAKEVVGADADNPFRAKSFAAIIGFFYLAGIGLAFTACMYPLIPILSGIIVGDGHQTGKLRGFLLSFAYVQGMAVAYALAGIAAGLSGTLLSTWMQNPWVLGGFSLFFVVMAGAMYGFYQVQMPSVIQSSLTERSNHLKGGRIPSVLLMGALSALIVGPCVAPPLALALGYIGQSGDVVLGGTSLYAMALGIGTPLIAVGVFGGHLLPRAGAWMNSVKAVFGTLMLAMALYIATPLLSPLWYMLGWAALLIVSAIYMHALDPLPNNASGVRKLIKGIGVIALLAGAALLIGALAGNRDVLQPLKGLQLAQAEAKRETPLFQRISSVAQLQQQLANARGRPVMLDFYADWCVSCKEMERFTFSDPAIRSVMANMLVLQADVTANSAEDSALLQQFGLFGPPAIVFFDAQGKPLPQRVIGFMPPEQLLPVLKQQQGAAA